jgi:hypothetical protein
MAPRLEHQRTPEMVGMTEQPLSFFEHGPSARRWETLDDQTQRFAGRVGIDGFDACHVTGWLLVSPPIFSIVW